MAAKRVMTTQIPGRDQHTSVRMVAQLNLLMTQGVMRHWVMNRGLIHNELSRQRYLRMVPRPQNSK